MKKGRVQFVVIVIILIFAISSVASIILQTQRIEEQREIELKYLFLNPISEKLRNEYLSRGFTILTFERKDNCCNETLDALKELQNYFSVNGQKQIIIEVINSSHTKIKIESLYGTNETDSTSVENIFNSLCQVVVFPVAECGILNETS